MPEEFATEKQDELIFQDAVDALRRGDRPRAKQLLTDLIKDDQRNATYWVWMSASVDNTKERIYCLQTALKLDPENGTAKRGLILLGALTPDETVQPFPMNRGRAWEEKLLLANEKPKERGFRVVARNPIVRFTGLTLITVGLFAVLIFGFILPRRNNIKATSTNTPGPSPTFTPTPTIFGATAPPQATFIGPTPLWMLIPATYTPTALYVNTPRAPQSLDQYRAAKAAFEQGDWDGFIQNVELILPLEPEAADLYYYLGEAYRFKGNANRALEAYNNALKINPDFGPPYLGLARARLMQNGNLNVEYLFDEAIARDPNFGEIYLERAKYFLHNSDPEAAIVDLGRADELMPDSPLVQITYAEAYRDLDDLQNALKYAELSYGLDITNLDTYLLLGQLYVENEQYQRAVESLEVYVTYEDESALAFAQLGQAYYELGNYEAAINRFDKAYGLNRNGLRAYYVYRGLANLKLNNIPKAIEYLEQAFDYDDQSFEVNLGLVEAYYVNETFGTAFLKVEGLRSLAKTDEQTAIVLYWRALIQEKRGETKDAIKTWQELLAMDPSVMSEEIRSAADLHLRTVITATNTPKPGSATPTRTRTPSPTPTK